MQKSKKVNVEVDCKSVTGDLKHTWRYIGYDENNFTTTPQGEELIAKFGSLEDAPYYFRTHHMLCTGNLYGTYKWGSTNAYSEDKEGNPVYNWEVVDNILDVYLRNNSKPFFEIGFMPWDLVDPKNFEGIKKWELRNEYQRIFWAYPPKDYKKWYDLIYSLVKHCVDKYGQEEVLTWYWELWNEPDIFYWQGTCEEFCKLFDYTEAAVHAVLPEARLGGPATTDPVPGSRSLAFLEKFLDHCSNGINFVTGEKGTRLDYITFHTKGGGYAFSLNAEKETPSVKKLVEQVKTGVEVIAKYGYGDREVVLSEADPDGWAAGGRFDNINMNFRNTEYYATYVASSYHHTEMLAKSMNADIRPIAWAFMFMADRCFDGTRSFTTQGIDKAVLNLFKMYGKMGDKSLHFKSSQEKNVLQFKDNFGTGEEPDVSGMAGMSGNGDIQIMIYSHHDDWDVEMDFEIELDISNYIIGEKAFISHYRIDKNHSNAYTEWVAQGKPDFPDAVQYEKIKSKDSLELMEPKKEVTISGGNIRQVFKLPAHAVSLLVISKE